MNLRDDYYPNWEEKANLMNKNKITVTYSASANLSNYNSDRENIHISVEIDDLPLVADIQSEINEEWESIPF